MCRIYPFAECLLIEIKIKIVEKDAVSKYKKTAADSLSVRIFEYDLQKLSKTHFSCLEARLLYNPCHFMKRKALGSEVNNCCRSTCLYCQIHPRSMFIINVIIIRGVTLE